MQDQARIFWTRVVPRQSGAHAAFGANILEGCVGPLFTLFLALAARNDLPHPPQKMEEGKWKKAHSKSCQTKDKNISPLYHKAKHCTHLF